MNSKTPRLSRRDLMVASGMLAVCAGSGGSGEELGVSLVVVRGHEGCGAVKAAIRVIREKVELPGSIAMIAAAIQPTVEKLSASSDSLLPQAVEASVVAGIDHLRSAEPILASQFPSDKVRLVGAVYDLKTGFVRFLNEF